MLMDESPLISLTEDDILFQREKHVYIVNGKPVRSVTQIRDDAGLGDNFSMVPPDLLRQAQNRGNAVHAACAFLDAGELDWGSVDPRIEGYVRAYEEFKRITKIKTIQVERQMAGKILRGSASLDLAGTPDWVCFLNGQRCIIDLKTSQVLGKSAGLQTVGYKLLWESKHPSELVRERYGLRLGKDARFKLIPHEDPLDEMAFLDALEFCSAKRKMEPWLLKYGNGF